MGPDTIFPVYTPQAGVADQIAPTGAVLPAARVAPLVMPSEHVLILYNSNGADSVALKDYYLANRPGIAGANVLGLACPGTGESISAADYITYIRTPVVAWLAAHSDKPIKYVICCGHQFPRRIPGTWSLETLDNRQSLAHRLSVCQQEVVVGGTVTSLYYTGASNTRFLGPNYYPPMSFIPTFLLAANLADEKAYVDKLKRFGDLYSPGSLIISPSAGGYNNSHYYFDDTRDSDLAIFPFAAADAAGVLAENPAATITTQLVQAGPPIQALANIRGYRGFGGNNGIAGWNGDPTGATFVSDGKLQGSGQSNWYPVAMNESFTGQVDGENQLSWYGQWFAANALAGTAYQYTPAVMFTTTEEPGATGVATSVFFRFWERGYMAADCGYAALAVSQNFFYEMIVGDPFVTK